MTTAVAMTTVKSALTKQPNAGPSLSRTASPMGICSYGFWRDHIQISSSKVFPRPWAGTLHTSSLAAPKGPVQALAPDLGQLSAWERLVK